MDSKIFKNSYVIFFITFIMLCVIFYVFEWGYTVQVDNQNRVIKKFSWKYPLAFSLLIWIVWHFYVYPPAEELENSPINPIQEGGSLNTNKQSLIIPEKMLPRHNQVNIQKINMMNWH
jgi:hypothetical protein